MISSVDEKKAAIRAFDPSFSGSTVQPFQSLFDLAYKRATDETSADNIFKVIRESTDNETSFVFEASIGGNVSWFEYGHLPDGGGQLSGFCPFRITFKFDGDNLTVVELVLFILNPRFLFSDRGYRPAILGANFHYTIAGGTEHVGLVLSRSKDSSGNADKASIFKELTSKLPARALDKPTGPWRAFEQGALLGRIDIDMSWRAVNGKFPFDAAGKAKNRTVASITGGTAGTKLTLFSPGLDKAFSGLIHESDRFGVNLEIDGMQSVDAIVVLGDHSDVNGTDSEKLQAALHDFGLQQDFRGIVFSNIGAHWLDDGAMGVKITTTKAALATVSFQESTTGATPARIYASVTCEVNPIDNNSYLKLLEEGATFSLSLAGRKVRACSLSATFQDTEKGLNPYIWLSKRKASISLTSIAVNGNGGPHEEYGLDISFDADEKSSPLASYTATELGLDDEAFTYLASVLTLAPVFKLAAKLSAPPNANDGRVRFVEVSSDSALKAVFGASALSSSWFFKHALVASEFRVTGARILSQPTADQKRETAILFDIETEFSVKNDALELKSSRALAVRVENTGILYSAKKYHWVQVLQGAFKISILDSSVWDLGGLASLLKVKDISLKIDGAPKLDLTVGMNLDLGVVTADDFKIAFDIGSPDMNFAIYPSKIRINVDGVLEGIGEISFGRGKEFFKDVAGKMDLKLASGLRMSAAARVAHFQQDTKTAFAAGAKVEFPKPIPLLNSGLGIKGFEALYASHFRRKEKPAKGGVPASLQWLQDANGEVAIDSIANKDLWEPKYDRWSYGLGMIAVLEGNDQLLNLNTILVLDVPGPTITAFAKLNILKKPESNEAKSGAHELATGILGILQLDIPSQTLTLGALVEYELAFIRIYGAIENRYSLNDLTDWHFYLGHFNRQISAVLKLGNIINTGVTGYFMAAGKCIPKVPRGNHGEIDLPGLALALGARAYVHIGSGVIYLTAEMQAFLDLSISRDVYAAGGLELSGELFLFIAGIGISTALRFEFYSGARGVYLAIEGEVCGRIKIGLLKLRGCVHVRIGGSVPNEIAIPPLVGGANLVAGANVALLGQGATGGIDSTLAPMKKGGAYEDVTSMPLDAVLVFSMASAPRISGKDGFLNQLSAAAPITTYNYGKKSGGYEISEVSLKKLRDGGGLSDIVYGAASAVWWRSTQKPGNGQPLSIDLALLTRRPFGAQNAMPSEETMKRWIDALTSVTGVCGTVFPQVGIHTVPVSAEGGIDAKTQQLCWHLFGRFKDAETDTALNGSHPGLSTVKVDERRDYGKAEDRFAGYPRYLSRKVVEKNPTRDEPAFAFLSVLGLPGVMDGPPTSIWFECAGFARAVNQEPKSRFIELLVATAIPLDDKSLEFRCESEIGSVSISVTVEQLTADGKHFHDEYLNWKAETAGFFSLSGRPGYGQLSYGRVIIELAAEWEPLTPPLRLKLTWPRTSAFDQQPLFIGAIKFLSIEEVQRFERHSAYNSGIVAELEGFLRKPLVPILEPSSKYEVSLKWNTVVGGGIAPASATDKFRFTTTADPPRRLAPYLLATFPAVDEQLHPYHHQPGFSISSGDILRILGKHRGLQLKITVVEDGNSPVYGTDAHGNKINWSDGQCYDPATLLDVIADIPSLDRKWFEAIPSPLLRALKTAIVHHKLQCLDRSIAMDQGLWIGLMIKLEPLLGYTIRLEVVDSTGKNWAFKEKAENAGLPFLEWHFRAGIHANLDELREAFKRPVPRSRTLLELTSTPVDDFARQLGNLSRLVEVCDEYRDMDLKGHLQPPASSGVVAMIPDHSMEDLLSRWIAERAPLDSETEKTVLWAVDGNAASASAIVLRSREPMLRRTQTAKIERSTTDAGSADVLKLDWIITRYPSLAASTGVKALYVTSSGTCAVALLDSNRGSGKSVVIRAIEYPPHYLPHEGTTGLSDLAEISAGELKR